MARYFILFILILLNSTVFFSQTKGIVLDASNGDPIIGARIVLSSGQKSITSNSGEFILSNVKYPNSLVVSMMGFISETVKLSKDTLLMINLKTQVQEISDVVVTASRRNQNIEDVPISMEIIKPELINNKGFSNLEQAVDQSPGVYAMDGQVSIRGGGGFAYGAGSRVALLWNGVPMMSPDIGDAKWNAIPMEQTSQIEILKGASSVLYGSGALNGIIALTEKEPSPKGNFSAKVQSGVYGNPRRKSMQWWDKNPTFHLADVYFGKSYKYLGYTVGANAYLDSGFRQGENEKRFRLNGSFYFKPKSNSKLKAGLSYNAQYQDMGVFILWKNDSLGYQAQDNTLSRQKAIRINVDPYIKFYDKFQNQHQLKTRYYLVTSGNESKVGDASIADLFYADYQFQRKFGASMNLSAGITHNSGQVKSWVFGDHISSNSALYGQVESKFKQLDITAGMRIEHYKLDEMKADSRFKLNDSLSIPVYPIFRMGLHYKLTPATHLRASFGQGVRFPSIAERFVSTSVGGLTIFKNPNLKPEKGWSSELGFKQLVKLGSSWKGFFDVAAFINEYSNMTEFTFGIFKPDTMGNLQFTDPNALNYLFNWVGFQAQNAEKARITGIEFSFNSQGKIGEVELTSLLGYTYMNPISLNNDPAYRAKFSDASSNMLKYRFNHLAKADIQATFRKFSLGISFRYNSFMKNIDKIFENSVEAVLSGGENGTIFILPGLKEYRKNNNSGALVFDTRFIYHITKEMKLNLIVNNLFNAEYVSRPADLQAPRNFLLQLQYAF
ncbi:MAG: TonB-dependent receptor [Flavobacteriales bacterium]|nr:TonB-dependent receptor [Flavobacteriales bacterium]